MIKEAEINYYRQNVIGSYIEKVMHQLAIDEQAQQRLLRMKKHKYIPKKRRTP